MSVHEMQIMDTSGHLTVTWDAEKEDEVTSAREQFEKMTRKGYRAFEVNDKGGQGSALSRFDPDVEEMILVPALRGG